MTPPGGQIVTITSGKYAVRKASVAVNLENNLDRYLESNKDPKEEVELTMKGLADKYYKIFRDKPYRISVDKGKDTKQSQAIKSLKLKFADKATMREESHINSGYLDYIDSIHIASLLGDYAENNHEDLHSSSSSRKKNSVKSPSY